IQSLRMMLKDFLQHGAVTGALYVVYDSGLLGSSQQGTEVLGKAKTAIPPAINEWMKYFGMEVNKQTLFQYCLICMSFFSGVRTTFSTLSEGPTKICDYTSQGFQYLKDLAK
uniref:MICOS complex subunit MIC13 n=1 Tax=Gadus morhua TaxID=8049 RepID=A0A8C4ZEV6_GADMO